MHFDRTFAVCAMSPVVYYFPPLSDMGGALFPELESGSETAHTADV